MTAAPTSADHAARVPLWRRPFQLIAGHRRAYLWISVAAYGLTLIGFVVGMLFPGLNQARVEALDADGTSDLVGDLLLNPPVFALVILGVNIGKLALGFITLPSLLVPFAGMGVFGYWAVETGITLAPTSGITWVQLIPHSLTVLVELQAYVLLLLGVWLLGRHWLSPSTAGAPDRRHGYLRGLRCIGLLSLPALGLLVVGALWEAYSLRYLVQPLAEWLL